MYYILSSACLSNMACRNCNVLMRFFSINFVFRCSDETVCGLLSTPLLAVVEGFPPETADDVLGRIDCVRSDTGKRRPTKPLVLLETVRESKCDSPRSNAFRTLSHGSFDGPYCKLRAVSDAATRMAIGAAVHLPQTNKNGGVTTVLYYSSY